VAGMIASPRAINVVFCESLRKTAFQFGSVKNFDPSSPRAAAVRSDWTACAREKVGPSAAATLAHNADHMR